MKKIKLISKEPNILGEFPLVPPEVMYYLYLPISLRGWSDYRIPYNLRWLSPILSRIESVVNEQVWKNNYIYVTCKNFFVEPGTYGNRPGWHADGFQTKDLNYLWYNWNPTQFCVQEFDVDADDMKALGQFEEQANSENIKMYPTNHLIEIDSTMVHRVGINHEGGLRCFVKISISEHRYNLGGNSHNPLLDYNWEFHSREKERNMESNKDYHEETPIERHNRINKTAQDVDI